MGLGFLVRRSDDYHAIIRLRQWLGYGRDVPRVGCICKKCRSPVGFNACGADVPFYSTIGEFVAEVDAAIADLHL